MSLKSHKSTLLKEDKKKDKGNKSNKKPLFISPLKDYVYIPSDKKKVVAYMRVSTKSESQATSIEQNQPAFFKNILNRKEFKDKYEIIGYYPEWYTGTKILRPVFEVLLEDAGLKMTKKPINTFPFPTNPKKIVIQYQLKVDIVGTRKYDEIWVKNTSRFARNVAIMTVLENLKFNGIVVRFLDINMDTEKDSIADINEKINADMQYSETLSNNVRMAKQLARELGVNPGNGKTFGYNYYPKTRTNDYYYTINEQEAEIIRFIYDVYLNGFNGEEYGTQRLTKLLSLSIPELNKKPMYTRKGKPFAKSTIDRILKNPFYKGYETPGKHSQPSGTLFDIQRKTVVNKNIKPQKGKHPSIIEEEIWDAVQNKLKRNSTEKNGKTIPINPSSNFYSKYLVCGLCGKNFRHDNNRGTPYYTCATKEDEGFNKCKVNNVYTKQLDALINTLAKTDYHELFKTDVESKLSTLTNFIEGEIKSLNNSISNEDYDTLNKKIEITESKLSILLNEDDEDEDEFIIDEIIKLKNRLKLYKRELKDIETPDLIKLKTIHQLFEAIHSIINYYENLPKQYSKEDILNNIDKIAVYGIRPTKKPQNHKPTLIPYFKFTSDKIVEEFIDSLEIDIPTHTYTVMSGIEYFDKIDEYINNKQLNKQLLDYIKRFDNLNAAKDSAKEDLDISNDLKAYIMYFDSIEEALSDNKLSPYDKDLMKKSFIYPTKRNKQTAEFDYDLEDLRLMNSDRVITFNDKGELIEDVGYSLNLGVEGHTPIENIKRKITTLEKSFKFIKNKKEKPL